MGQGEQGRPHMKNTRTRILTGLSGLACVGLNLKPVRFKPGSVSATRICRQMRVYFQKATSSILKRTNC